MTEPKEILKLFPDLIHCAARSKDTDALCSLYSIFSYLDETYEKDEDVVEMLHYVKTILDTEPIRTIGSNGLMYYDNVEDLALDYELAKIPITAERFAKDVLHLCNHGYVYADYNNTIDLIRQEGVFYATAAIACETQ